MSAPGDTICLPVPRAPGLGRSDLGCRAPWVWLGAPTSRSQPSGPFGLRFFWLVAWSAFHLTDESSAFSRSEHGQNGVSHPKPPSLHQKPPTGKRKNSQKLSFSMILFEVQNLCRAADAPIEAIENYSVKASLKDYFGLRVSTAILPM